MITVDYNVSINILIDESFVSLVSDGCIVVTIVNKFVITHAGEKLSFGLDILIDKLIETYVFFVKTRVCKVARNDYGVKFFIAALCGILVSIGEESLEFCFSVLIVGAVEVNVAANNETENRCEILGSFRQILINSAKKRLKAEKSRENYGQESAEKLTDAVHE